MEQSNQITPEEYQLQVLEAQYVDDIRQKNRVIAELRTRLQMALQRLQEYEASESDEVDAEIVEEGPREVPASG